MSLRERVKGGSPGACSPERLLLYQRISFLFYESPLPKCLSAQDFMHAFDARILIHLLYGRSAQFPQITGFSVSKRFFHVINPLYPQTYPHFPPF
jgi:hypothetical protein